MDYFVFQFGDSTLSERGGVGGSDEAQHAFSEKVDVLRVAVIPLVVLIEIREQVDVVPEVLQDSKARLFIHLLEKVCENLSL